MVLAQSCNYQETFRINSVTYTMSTCSAFAWCVLTLFQSLTSHLWSIRFLYLGLLSFQTGDESWSLQVIFRRSWRMTAGLCWAQSPLVTLTPTEAQLAPWITELKGRNLRDSNVLQEAAKWTSTWKDFSDNSVLTQSQFSLPQIYILRLFSLILVRIKLF